jgi:hypothetical protein
MIISHIIHVTHPSYGKIHTLETRLKMSLSAKNRYKSPTNAALDNHPQNPILGVVKQ